MSTGIQDALRRGPSSAVHMVKTQAELYPHVQSGDLALRRSAVPVIHRRRTQQVYLASTTPETALASGGFADIRLQGCDVIDSIVLRLTVSNATGAALSQWFGKWAWSLISHVDVLAEGGSVTLETIHSEHMIREWALLDRDRHLAVHKGLTGDQDAAVVGAAPPTIPDGTSRTIYIPLLGSMLSSLELAPFALASPLILRVYFNAAAFVGPYLAQQLPNGKAGLSISAFDAVVTAHLYDNSERQGLTSRYALAGIKTPPLALRYARSGQQRSVENITSTSGFFNLRLSSIQGLITSMNVIVRDLTLGGTGTFYAVQAVDLLDEKGASVYGQPLDFDLLLATECRDQGITAEDVELSRVTPIPIGGESTEHSGAISSYIVMNGNHVLALQMPFVGAAEITVIYRSVSHASISKSHVTVHAS